MNIVCIILAGICAGIVIGIVIGEMITLIIDGESDEDPSS